MSIHENPVETLQALWHKQYNDERLYADLVRFENKFLGKARTLEETRPLAEGLERLRQQLYEGRRLLEAMHLHIKTHHEQPNYALRKVSGFRYTLNNGHGSVWRDSATVLDDFPLGLERKPSGYVLVEKNANPSTEWCAMIDRLPGHDHVLLISSQRPFWAYVNGCLMNLCETPKMLQTNDHILVENTSLIIDWISRFLHHRATGRVIIHGLFCSY